MRAGPALNRDGFWSRKPGEVVEIGSGVERIKVGDYVCLPFNVGCGFAENCEKGLTGFCLTTNPGSAGAAYGFAEMGPWEGGRRNCFGCHLPTLTALFFPLMRQKKKMIM